jgi:TolB protein
MNHRRAILSTAVAATLALAASSAPVAVCVGATVQNSGTHVEPGTPPHGVFDQSADIGTVLHRGTTHYVPGTPPFYMLAASGENIWGTADAFQFAYKKESGDVDLTADISFVGAGTNPHRKAVLMIRQSLDANSPYVDAALHGSGLLSLQYRDVAGGPTTEIETLAPQTGLPLLPVIHGTQTTEPVRIRLVKCGRNAYLYVALKENDKLAPSGASIQIPFHGDFYVGIGLSSHEKDVTEEAIFSNVTFGKISPKLMTRTEQSAGLYSTLETIAIDSTIRTIAFVQQGRFEAPNWTRDGAAFLFNREGRIWRLPAVAPGPPPAGTKAPAAPPEPVAIDTGFATRCNNDHGISPDGTQIVISDNSQDAHDSILYTLPITGATTTIPPHRITAGSPSYWHGWSPDGKTLAFVGQRNGDFDIFTVPADATNSQNETRLTTAKGLDDGPEYTPDGQWIYFNSERTGHMQIWRMHADGSAQEQVTHDDWNNWFPHFSPDGKWMVMLSYDASVTGHPENKDVQLRLMSMADGKITPLARLFGGQGTINVPSWSPDSKHLAFVSYELLPHEDAK